MIIWIVGMSAAGKTVVSKELYALLKKDYNNTILIDGDVFRGLFKNDLTHSIPDRKLNAERMRRLCHFFDQQQINVIVAILCIFPEDLDWNRDTYSDYYEVYLKAKFDVLKERDNKGLYEKGLKNEMKDVVGIDIDFPEPKNADIVIVNEGSETPFEIAKRIYDNIDKEKL